MVAQLEGATLADTLKAGEKTLKLNGLGLRKKAFQEGFEANAKDEAAQKAAFDKMLTLVPDVKRQAAR